MRQRRSNSAEGGGCSAMVGGKYLALVPLKSGDNPALERGKAVQ